MWLRGCHRDLLQDRESRSYRPFFLLIPVRFQIMKIGCSKTTLTWRRGRCSCQWHPASGLGCHGSGLCQIRAGFRGFSLFDREMVSALSAHPASRGTVDPSFSRDRLRGAFHGQRMHRNSMRFSVLGLNGTKMVAYLIWLFTIILQL